MADRSSPFFSGASETLDRRRRERKDLLPEAIIDPQELDRLDRDRGQGNCASLQDGTGHLLWRGP